MFFVATKIHIYLDESGDTGWLFELPYPHGGSSRYLVIAACLLPEALLAKPEQVVRQLFRHQRWNKDAERKWSRMSPTARSAFAVSAAALVRHKPEIQLMAIVVDKRLVRTHIWQDPDRLYNYMVRRLLLDEMANHDRVSFRPDPRSMKSASGLSLHEYLQTELWFTTEAPTLLETVFLDSRGSPNLQFVDMVSGVVHAHFEFGEQRNWALLEPHVRLEKLNFE